MLRSKRNYKENSNEYVPYNEPQIISDQKQISHKDHCIKEEMIVSNVSKENWNCNRKLRSYLHEHQNIAAMVLKETNLMNSDKRHIQTRSALKRKCDVESEGSLRKISRSAHTKNQILNKYEENTCNPLPEKYNSDKKSNKNKIPYIRRINNKATTKHDLQRTNHIHNKPKIYCDICNKKLYEHQNKTFCKSQQEDLCNYEIESFQSKSVEVQRKRNTKQSILKTNVQTLIDSRSKTDFNVSRRIKKKNNREINNSTTIRQSKNNARKKNNKQSTEKSTYHRQLKRKTQQKVYHTLNEYKQYISETEENEYFKGTLETKNTNIRFSEITIAQSNKADIKMDKDIVKYKNINDKKLLIPLIRIDDIAQLSKSTYMPDYVKNYETKLKKQASKRIYYQAKNIAKAQCSTYKHINRLTKLNHKNKINVMYSKSIFKDTQIHTNFKENVIKEIDTNIKDFKFETNDSETFSQNGINNTDVLQDNECTLPAPDLLENILQFFLRNKKMINARTRQKSKINFEKMYSRGRRKGVAMCSKCKEAFSLLQKFSDRLTFVQDEKLCIECTLCNLQINSLYHFQQHVMDIHLQCEGKLSGRKKFPVDVININDQLNFNNDDHIIFECCCCSKVFDHKTNFEKHINKVHYRVSSFVDNIKECQEAKQIVRTSELYTTFKDKQVFNESHTLNKNLTFGSTTSLTEVCDQREEDNIENNNHMNKKSIMNYTSTKEMNFKNSIYYNNSNSESLLLKVEVQEQQINNVNHSSARIARTTKKIKKSTENLNTDKKCLNSISKITIISESGFSNISRNETNKNRKQRKKNFSFICNICCKKYKRKVFLLAHMSKHAMHSHDDLYKIEKIPEVSNNNKMIKFNDNLAVSKICATSFQDYSKNSKDNLSILNPVVNLEEPNENIAILDVTNKEVRKVKNENVKYVSKKDISMETDDCNHILHINLTQKSEKGIKKEQLIKFYINITKVCKTDIGRQQNMGNEIGNKFVINPTSNTNFIEDFNKRNVNYGFKELRCNICNKRFSSQTILKEHMFFLHDSLIENTELSHLAMMPYVNDYSKIENFFKNNTHKFMEKHNMLPEIRISKNFLKETIYQIFNKNNTDKKRKKWRCGPCKENFALLRNYLRHKYYCHNDESVVHLCDNCNKILTSVAMVNIHMCTNVTSWNCKRCNLNFCNGISLTQHNMDNHWETVGPHACEICKVNFLTTYMLKRHKTVHSINNSNNSLNSFTNASEFIRDHLSHISSNTNVNNEFSEEKIEPINDKVVSCVNKNLKIFNALDELNKTFSEMYITSNMPYNDEEMFKCKHCNILCTTELEMKIHLDGCHKVEMCQICNKLHFTNELIKHIIHHHMVSDNLCFEEDNIQTVYETINFQNDILKFLGLKRLLSLYEYQRFDNMLGYNGFECIICSEQFFSIQCYKIHYLRYHDTICLLCNIGFENNFEAFEHKIKIHKSTDEYLWIVHKLILAILQLNKHGCTIEEVILKYSETRIC
ncbi:unnamed protein product [Xylocopa violacea]|uniref:C2H2-type domain-containing protein n=1 Tax=Xylocopa violacea TaxID=135666 RepID=A0ABP1NT15_XYLVO